MGTRGMSGTMHGIPILMIQNTELEIFEEIMCISSCFNNKQQKTQFQWLIDINTYFSSHRGLGCELDWVCLTFLLIPEPRQKGQSSSETCCACGKEWKLKWPSQIRNSCLKLLSRHSISHITHISLAQTSHMAKPWVTGEGTYNLLTGKEGVKSCNQCNLPDGVWERFF